jgi:small subunit ribosomal protein S9
MVTKTPSTASAKDQKPVRKPRATTKTSAVKKTEVAKEVALHTSEPKVEAVKAHKPLEKGRYVFATGRRKTAVANIRLFAGEGENMVNKKPLKTYFAFPFYQETIFKPFDLTGQRGNYNFTVTVNGGGIHAQSTAVQHGIAIALSKASPEHRQILKKNGMLTRDDRKKERKKPGLKRARRSPQWAKR